MEWFEKLDLVFAIITGVILITLVICIKKVFYKDFFIDKRDNQKYRIVKIGTQVWMAENLKYDVSGSMCYGNDPANCAKYGKLYDWVTAMRVAPSGWHLPSDDEWQTLVKYADPNWEPNKNNVAGCKLKTMSGWHENKNGIDEYGFSALPGGAWGDWNHGNIPDFHYLRKVGHWWSSTSFSSTEAWYWDIGFKYPMNKHQKPKTQCYSVRCVQD